MSENTPAKNKDQFMLRLPDGMRERITVTAKQNNRSMNAEIVAQLEASLISSATDRLLFVLEAIRVGSRQPLTASHLAEAIGEKSPVTIESIFSRTQVPEFSLLQKIATYLHINEDWLKHGSIKPNSSQIPFLVSNVSNFNTEFADKLIAENTHTVFLVRCNDADGGLTIVRQIDDHKSDVKKTNIHLSENIGSGGEANLIRFWHACKHMWELKRGKFTSLQMEPNQYKELISGKIYPLTAVQNAKRAHWFDDWWDPKMFEGRNDQDEYWIGYRDFCKRIYNAIEKDIK